VSSESGASAAGASGGFRTHWPVAVFTVGYLTVALIGAILRGNLEFLFYIAVMLVLISVVLTVHRSVGLSSGALWGLSIWGLLHMAGGLLVMPEGWPVSAESRVLYTLWLIPGRLKYDQIVHAYGFGMTTWVCWQALQSAIRRRRGKPEASVGLMVLWIGVRSAERGRRVRGHALDPGDQRRRLPEYGLGPGVESDRCHDGGNVDLGL
jgi:hypothetical protein